MSDDQRIHPKGERADNEKILGCDREGNEMDKNQCYLGNHDWRFVSFVQHADGSRYTLTRCVRCWSELRTYDSGREERVYGQQLRRVAHK
jgi:hypothetical protein